MAWTIRVTCAAAAAMYGATMMQTAPIDADALPVMSLKETARIGSADDSRVGFNAILSVDVDRDGQLYVYESKDREIRVLSRDGRPLRTIGKAGRGPGEFTRVDGFGVIGDTVWTVDLVGLQLNLFQRNGARLVSRQPVVLHVPLHGGSVGDIWPQMMREDGRFISTFWGAGATHQPNRVAASDTVMAPRVRFSTAGAIDTIGWEPVPPPDASAQPPRGATRRVQMNGASFDVPQPPIDGYIRTSLNDGSAIVNRARSTNAQSGTFALTRFDLAGKRLHSLRFGYKPGRYAGAVLDSIAMRPVRQHADENPAAFKAVRAAMVYPEFQAPIYTVWAANDGALWLRREDNAGARFRWIVVNRVGTVRGITELPRSARPAWSNGNQLIAIDTDDDGIPWLVRYEVGSAR